MFKNIFGKQENNKAKSPSVIGLLLKYLGAFLFFSILILGVANSIEMEGLGIYFLYLFSFPTVFVICMSQGIRELDGTGKVAEFAVAFFAIVLFLGISIYKFTF